MDRKSRAPRGDWRTLNNKVPAAIQLQVPRQQQQQQNQQQPAPNRNPYAGVNISAYDNNTTNNNHLQPNISTNNAASQNQFLSVDNIDRAKVHRRFSVRLNGPPQLDFQHQPLPMNAQSMIKNEQNYSNDSTISNKQHLQQQQQLQHQQHQQHQQQKNKYISIGNLYDDELDALSQPNFDANVFIKEKLSNATATKIDDFSKSLNKMTIQVDDNIKDVINKSLENLSKTSKDFNETELEIKHLKTIFNELNEIIQNMKETADLRLSLEQNQSSNGSKRDRSSILMVQKLWDKELQSLFNHVAGAQQLLTPVPGRHVLAESGKWHEIGVTTMKSLQVVHLFVLNDHLLVASKRRQNDDNNSGNKYNKSQNLIASQCWPLRDAKIFDVKVPNSDFHFLKVVYQSSTFLYKTERSDHHNKILNACRRAKDELRTIADNDKTIKPSGSVSRTASQLNNRRSASKEHRSSGILNKSHQRTRSLEIFTNDTIISMKSLDDNIDELDIQISRKDFGNAVVLLKVIESELNKISNKKMDMDVDEIIQIIENLKLRLHNRRELVIDELTKRIYSDNKSSVIEIKKLTDLFGLLNIPDVGRDHFLKARELMMNNLMDKVEINGIIPDFITQISIIRFQVIKTTIKVYQACFQGDDQSCFLVDWCFNQVRRHVKFLDQQLNGVDMRSINYVDCVRVTKSQVEDLKIIGIDVGFLLDDFYKSAEGNGV